MVSIWRKPVEEFIRLNNDDEEKIDVPDVFL